MTLVDYRRITKKGSIIQKYPVSYVPKPSTADYSRGYIERYFVKPTSNKTGTIIEVDKPQYEIYARKTTVASEAMLYSATKLRWKIKGNREQIISSNSISVSKANKTIPGISLKLGNLLQFWNNS